MIRCILKPQKNSYVKIITWCPDCGARGQLTRSNQKLLVRHKTKTGQALHRVTGELFDEMKIVYNLYGTKPFEGV